MIIDLKESLEREMHQIEERLDGVILRLDGQGARLDRQGGILAAGQRWTLRHGEWAEHVDQALVKRDKQIESILKRLGQIESKQANRKQ